MSEKSKYDYDDFFSDLREFEKLQNKQKQRGLNNYNLLTAVLSPFDEVRMHSRMIYSLLNPSGEHFQGTLFLEKFLKILNVEGFGVSDLNLDNCSVFKEYENIDLYITDGTKHIIIENKVHAGDQKNQIKRYIELIKKEHEEAQAADILVLYLTLDGKIPSQWSLGCLRIQGNNIFRDESKEAHYKSIQYKAEIMAWLDECQHEVQNITNLNQAVAAYKDVVKMINKEYKGKAMSLADYITESKDRCAMALAVNKAMPEVRKYIVDVFFENVVNQLQKELGDNWVIEIDDDLSVRYSTPLRIYREEWDKLNCLLFSFDFAKKDYKECYLGITRSNDNITIKAGIKKKYKAEITKLNKKLQTTEWWLHWEWFHQGDFIEYINTEANAEQNLVDAFMSFIVVFENKSGLLTKINEDIQNKKANV